MEEKKFKKPAGKKIRQYKIKDKKIRKMRYNAKSEKFFTKEEKEKIKNTTKDVEKHTTGEIAVVVADHSSNYPEAEITGGIFLGSLISLVVSVLFFHSSIWVYIPCTLLFYVPALFFFRKYPTFKAAFIGKKRMQKAVKERALRTFYEKGLYRTKNQTGVLFFLSLLERKVWVLADRGIHERIKQTALNSLALKVSKGIREGRSCDALCEAIKEAGKLLAEHYPAKPGDIDELTNKVMCDSGSK